tara:strand:- start:82 stop:1248 length:1167 start_codon:yes stop_codon:yes gene_type:complete
MSDIRFNNWLHQSGTGGVYQTSTGNVGVGTTVPRTALDVAGIVTATSFSGVNVTASGDSTFGGLVGIGSDIPTDVLDILTGSSDEVTSLKVKTGGRVELSRNHASDPYIKTLMNSGNPNIILGDSGGDKVLINGDGDTYFNGGKVGIGTDQPSVKLSVRGTIESLADRDGTSASEGGQLVLRAPIDQTGTKYRYGVDCYWGNTIYGRLSGDEVSGVRIIREDDNPAANGITLFTVDQAGLTRMPYQPAFRAGRSGNYSPGAGADIIFNSTAGTGKFNTGNHYDTSNGRFTAPCAGTYIFAVHVIWQNLPNGKNMADAFHPKINGTQVGYSGRRGEYIANETGNNGYYTDWNTFIYQLNDGDYVTIDNQFNVEVHGNAQYTTFSGYLLG